MGTALGRILLMDDDLVIRKGTAHLLRFAGYEVDVAPEGGEAVRLYDEAMREQTPYAAVVLDLSVQEGMGGLQTMEELQRLDPDVRCVLSSGYSSDPVVERYREFGFRGVLTKPYKLDDLRRVLEAAMGE